jgi:hypothetical protein
LLDYIHFLTLTLTLSRFTGHVAPIRHGASQAIDKDTTLGIFFDLPAVRKLKPGWTLQSVLFNGIIVVFLFTKEIPVVARPRSRPRPAQQGTRAAPSASSSTSSFPTSAAPLTSSPHHPPGAASSSSSSIAPSSRTRVPPPVLPRTSWRDLRPGSLHHEDNVDMSGIDQAKERLVGGDPGDAMGPERERGRERERERRVLGSAGVFLFLVSLLPTPLHTHPTRTHQESRTHSPLSGSTARR